MYIYVCICVCVYMHIYPHYKAWWVEKSVPLYVYIYGLILRSDLVGIITSLLKEQAPVVLVRYLFAFLIHVFTFIQFL